MANNDYRALFLYGEPELTLSGGGWLAGSLNNLLEPRLERIARSIDLAPSHTRFQAVLKHPTSIAALYLGWTNLTSDANVAINFWPTSSFSGTPLATLNPVIPDDPDPDRRPSIYAVLSDAVTTQFVSVDIDDQLNPIGYVDLGYLHLGPWLKSAKSPAPGSGGLVFNPNALVAQTMSGGEAVLDKNEPRSQHFTFDTIRKDQILGDIFAMQRAVKRGGVIIAIPDPSADPVELQRQSFYGHAISRDPLARTSFMRGSWGVEVKEVMGLKPEVIAAIVRLTLDAGRFAFTFPDTSLTYGQAAGFEAGHFVLTGEDIAFMRTRRLAAGVGTFALSGQALTLRRALRAVLANGSFSLTGGAVALKRAVRVALANGSFALTGGSVGLIVRRLTMDGGSFALTGGGLAFKRGLRLPLGAGSFALTGPDVGMSSGIRILLFAGSFGLTGAALGLAAARKLALGTGSFAFTGGSIWVPVTMQLETGAFALSASARLLKAKKLAVSGATFAMTGGDLGLTHQAKIVLGSGSFALSGQAVGLRNYHLRIGAGDQAGNIRVLAGDAAGNRRRTTN